MKPSEFFPIRRLFSGFMTLAVAAASLAPSVSYGMSGKSQEGSSYSSDEPKRVPYATAEAKARSAAIDAEAGEAPGENLGKLGRLGKLDGTEEDLKALFEAIQAATKAQPDLLTPLLQKAAALPFFRSDPQNPKTFFLKWPAELVLPQHETNFLIKTQVGLTHPFLTPLIKLIETLGEKAADPLHGDLCKSLKSAYETFANDLCSKLPEERLQHLQQVRMRTERSGHLILPFEMTNQLLSANDWDIVIRDNHTGSSPARRVGDLFFKRMVLLEQNPTFRLSTLDPGFEWGMYALNQALVGQGLTPSALLLLKQVPRSLPAPGSGADKLYQAIQDINLSATDRIRHIRELREQPQEEFKKHLLPYAVQATPFVEGVFVSDYVQKKMKAGEPFNLDEASFSAHVLSSLLLKPGDYKGDNVMITPDRRVMPLTMTWA